MVPSRSYCSALASEEPDDDSGLGARWEIGLLRQALYEAGDRGSRRFLVVLVDDTPREALSLWCRRLECFTLPKDDERLVRALGLSAKPSDDAEILTAEEESRGGMAAVEPRRSHLAVLLLVATIGVSAWALLDWLHKVDVPARAAAPFVVTPVAQDSVSPFGECEVTFLTSDDAVELVANGIRAHSDDGRKFVVSLEAPGREGPWPIDYSASAIDHRTTTGTCSVVCKYRSRAPRGFEIVRDVPAENSYAKTIREPVTELTLELVPSNGSTPAFYLGTTEVTVGQWSRFVDSRLGGFVTAAEQGDAGGVTLLAGGWTDYNLPGATWRQPIPRQSDFESTPRHPVTQITFDEALAFCAAFTSEKPVRLPEQAEWEWACRAGSDTTYWWGDDSKEAWNHANLADPSLAAIYSGNDYFEEDDHNTFLAPVATHQANAFGLYDMIGNVWEWCADDTGNGKRPLRGGSWGSRRSVATSGKALFNYTNARSDCIGFRVAMSLP